VKPLLVAIDMGYGREAATPPTRIPERESGIVRRNQATDRAAGLSVEISIKGEEHERQDGKRAEEEVDEICAQPAPGRGVGQLGRT
jgi:hypothetical protein